MGLPGGSGGPLGGADTHPALGSTWPPYVSTATVHLDRLTESSLYWLWVWQIYSPFQGWEGVSALSPVAAEPRPASLDLRLPLAEFLVVALPL